MSGDCRWWNAVYKVVIGGSRYRVEVVVWEGCIFHTKKNAILTTIRALVRTVV